MSKGTKVTIFLLRIGLGWLFLYSGLSKVNNPDWTAAGYLESAKTFPTFFQWLTRPENIIWVNFLNRWGQTLIGLGLIFGLTTRLASFWGIVLMVLYYLPALSFPLVDQHFYLIDDHVIYSLVFGLLIATGAGRYWGLDRYVENLRYVSPTWARRLFS